MPVCCRCEEHAAESQFNYPHWHGLVESLLVPPFTSSRTRSSRLREHLRYSHRSVWSRRKRCQNDDDFCSKGNQVRDDYEWNRELQCDSPDSRSVQRSLRGRWIRSCRI